MSKVKVVTAYVPLNVLHLNRQQYFDLGNKLIGACDGHVRLFYDFPYERLTYADADLPKVTATPVPADRYATVEDNIRSHVVQHNRTTWAMMAMHEYPDVDVWVWLDYGVMKQGEWNKKPITADHIRNFLRKVADYPYDDMPFPGIEREYTWRPDANNFRFCGSTHIWPKKWLPKIHGEYIRQLDHFLATYKTVPLDLAIWPMVEKASDVPYAFYQAEYDHTQFTEFP